jgi:tetratricopeptide (TPR) repeat protein
VAGTVTVLFTDLVASTELMARLGEAAYDRFRRDHFAALRTAVEHHGGNEVKNTGDGLMAVFPSASDAVLAGIAMQRSAATNRVELRVGIALGDATEEAGDWFGTPVVEAARLCSAGESGQVLVTDVVRAVAGAHADVEYTSLGPLTLKGLPDPVMASEVQVPAVSSALPLPPVVSQPAAWALVGRDAEWDRLLAAWKEATVGTRRVVLVGGEPGIGKTRLASELARRAHDEGGVVLAGRCDDGLGVPYQPFVEALGHLVRHAPDDRVGSMLGHQAGELVRVLPEIATRVPDLSPPTQSDPESEQYRFFDAVLSTLTACSREGPVLLVVDDLHWAARPTLLLLRHLVRNLLDVPVLVVGTYRDTDLDRSHPLAELLPDLRRETGVERILLKGLTNEGVEAFVVSAGGQDLEEQGRELAAAVHAETDGNPFFVGEVLRHLSESGAIYRREGRWTSDLAADQLGIPEGIREVVGRRVSALSETANRVLSLASVAGAAFDPDVVGVAGGIGEDELLDALDEAVRRGLVVEAGSGYRFSHALVRSVLYDEQSAARRTRAHGKVGAAIEQLDPDELDAHLGELAHHFAASGAETDKAVDYASRAGRRAMAALAFHDAVGFFGQALELLGSVEAEPAQRVELLIELGEAQLRVGAHAYRETLLEAASGARDLDSPALLVRAVLTNSRGFFSTTGEVDAERVVALEAALDALEPDDSPDRARLLARLALELHYSGDRDRRLALADASLTMARRLGDRRTLATVILETLDTYWFPSSLERYEALGEEALAITEMLGDPALLYRSWVPIHFVSMGTFDIARAEQALDKMQRLASESGQPPALRFSAAMFRCGYTLFRGDLAGAERWAEIFDALGHESAQPDADITGILPRFSLARLRGMPDDTADLVRTFAESTPNLPALWDSWALALVAYGRLEEARAALERLVPMSELPRDTVFTRSLYTRAYVAWALRAADVATDVRQAIDGFPDVLTSAGPFFGHPLSTVRGLIAATLGEIDEAEASFAVAADILERMGATVLLAELRVLWAEAIVERDRQRARALAEAAIAAAEPAGAFAIVRTARALLS